MKQNILILICAAGIMLSSCGGGGASRDEGVCINGVKWATRNIGADGKFVASAEETGFNGGFYSIPDSLFPKGWRLPTGAELASLIAAPQQYVQRNGVDGRLFGVEPNAVFLPFDSSPERYWSSSLESGDIQCIRSQNTNYMYSDSYMRDGAVRLVYDAGCDKVKKAATQNKGVVLNGIKWATCNVGEKGTFASAPEQPGGYYEQDEAQDACPDGWRLPTATEWGNLFALEWEFTTINGVDGWLIGTKPNTMFLPSAGATKKDGQVFDFNRHGRYWSSSKDPKYGSDYYLEFAGGYDSRKLNTHDRHFSRIFYSVRPVYDETGKKNKDFLTKNGKRPEVKTTASGLQYEVLTEGAGAKPKKTDKVKVHYIGKLIDGTEFESSVKNGKPFVFTLNQVIKGWTEGLQLMPVGSKYRFYISHELAYGEDGIGEKIPAFATLIFDVELLEINPKE